MPMQNFIIELTPQESEQACRDISSILPEWFGIAEANERYAKGVRERLTFGYFIDRNCVGILCLEFPFKNTASIYWMGVKRDWHRKGIGKALVNYAQMICLAKEIDSLTVETLSPKEEDLHYLKTFKFYLKEGFKPLFELNTYSSEYAMVYLHKMISPQLFEWVDLTHELSENSPTWDGDCGFRRIDIVNYEDCEAECKFSVQKIEVLAGIGTHIDAPAHCFAEGKTVNNILLQNLISPCIVVDVSEEAHADYCVDMATIKNFEKLHGKIWKKSFVIFRTGWDQFWSQPQKYRNDYHFPSIDKEVAKYLVSENIVGIGVDTLSPDTPQSGYPVHQILLGAGKYIVENIANAHLIPTIGSHLFVMPLLLSKATEAPIRLLAMVQKTYAI